MLRRKIAIAVVGLAAVLIPLEVVDSGAGPWSAVDVVFIAWLMTPFALLAALVGKLRDAELLVLGAGLTIATIGIETSIMRSESSTASIGLLFLPLYLVTGMVVVMLVAKLVRVLRDRTSNGAPGLRRPARR
jgi:hypothetical protein